MVQETAKNPN